MVGMPGRLDADDPSPAVPRPRRGHRRLRLHGVPDARSNHANAAVRTRTLTPYLTVIALFALANVVLFMLPMAMRM
jgi:hypothetical protein